MKAKQPTILVVDDEPETRKYVGMNLKARGYEILTAADGTEALKIFEERHVDLVLLDIAMPGPDGLQVCQRMRQISDVAIIMLSAHGRERDKVSALDLGADDYLTKPFGVEELLARVRAALRRAQGAGQSNSQTLEFGDLALDFTRHQVTIRGEVVRLTPIEYSILSLLARNAGKVLTHRAILNAVWGGNYRDEKEYVWAYVRRLRRKLEANPEDPAYILTEPGIGYRFATPRLAATPQ